MARSTDLTKGNITRGLWGFALPLMLGNVLQQLYNLVDTWADVLARVLVKNAELPIGIFTALVGAPFFIYIVTKKNYGRE
mgnify:CR=1 FL=1